MEWLFRSNFDTLTNIALWSIATVLVATITLFVYTVGLRVATINGAQRREKLLKQWRVVFANSMLDRHAAEVQQLPRVARGDAINLMEEWNRACASVDGAASANLIALAHRTVIPDMARRLFNGRRVRARILAVQTIGHLRDATSKSAIRELLDHENTALSITAAATLVEIDADLGIAAIVPMIDARRDWPKTRVSIVLRRAGSERVSEPMYRAIRSANNRGKTHLLQFARLMEAETLDALVVELLRESTDPGVLNLALKLVSGFAAVPRIAALTQHKEWFVRMQAAKVLGRIGEEEHLPLLEVLLGDVEWWVRYRAAQAITSLPFVGPNQLRNLRMRQHDRYAADILQQAFAEAGLA